MPMIRVETSVECEKSKRESIALELSSILAKDTGKPEAYVQAIVMDSASIVFAGKSASAAFVIVKGIGGLTPDVNKKLSKDICSCLESKLGIPQDCTYINFVNVPGTDWGWKGSTFA